MTENTLHQTALNRFVGWRYGMFIHYGIYSELARGEWVMNRERLTPDEIKAVAEAFRPEKFDAGALCDLALEGGMRYVNLTTMHHDGFRLYDTELSDFNTMRYCGRDLVAEFCQAARERGLGLVLYHSLNNWTDKPDGVDALESKDAYAEFIDNTFARIRELVERFKPFDVLWYDGRWPFVAEDWQAERMNAMVRELQPGILINGRNGLPGDFATPEQHVSPPHPWRPWEACLTLNNHWGFHRGDDEWKDAKALSGLLTQAAQGNGNLLINIGPRGDGSVPQASVDIIREVGRWLKDCGEAVYDTEPFTFDYEFRAPEHRGDWHPNGKFTAKGKTLYQILRFWPGETVTIGGLQTEVTAASLLSAAGEQPLRFAQRGDRVDVTGLPAEPPDKVAPVLKLQCAAAPEIYITGGMRIPKVPHPPYDATVKST